MNNIINIEEKRQEPETAYTTPGIHNFGELQLGKIQEAEALSVIQAILLQSALVKGDILPYTVYKIEQIQELKLSARHGYENDLQSMPLSQIAPGSQVEDIVRTLTKIGAKSTIFERYAWLGRRKQRSSSQPCAIL